MNKYEQHLVRNDIDELYVVELSEEFWRDRENWPEWFKAKASNFEEEGYSRPTDEDYDHGFIMYSDTLVKLSEEEQYLYENEGWKPTLFYGYDHQGIWNLTEDNAVGYFPKRDKVIFGTIDEFGVFFTGE